jgi:hypothetical protein
MRRYDRRVADLPDPKPKGLVELVHESAGDVIHGLGHGLGRGFDRAGAALATPEHADVTALLASVDLPELAARARRYARRGG